MTIQVVPVLRLTTDALKYIMAIAPTLTSEQQKDYAEKMELIYDTLQSFDPEREALTQKDVEQIYAEITKSR